MSKERTYGIDLTRTVAICFVLAVHSLLYNGFYSQSVQGVEMALGLIARMALISAVPLFLMLTGFLCVGRRWSRGYYRKLLPVLLIYLLACAVCLLVRIFWAGEAISLLGIARRVLDFSAAPYGWYVEMYMGLFLIMPFLNAGWHALEDKGKKALLLSLVVMTALPTLINLVEQIVPAWWTGIYPVTYYFVGAWLREHPIRAKRRWLFLGWIGIAAVVGMAYYVLHQVLRPGQVFYGWNYDYRASLPTLVQTVCLFSCLRQFDGSRTPAPVKWCVGRIAKITLPIHLVSYVGDILIYPVLCRHVASMAVRLALTPVMLLVNLVICGILGQLIDWAANAICKRIPERKKEFAVSEK